MSIFTGITRRHVLLAASGLAMLGFVGGMQLDSADAHSFRATAAPVQCKTLNGQVAKVITVTVYNDWTVDGIATSAYLSGSAVPVAAGGSATYDIRSSGTATGTRPVDTVQMRWPDLSETTTVAVDFGATPCEGPPTTLGTPVTVVPPTTVPASVPPPTVEPTTVLPASPPSSEVATSSSPATTSHRDTPTSIARSSTTPATLPHTGPGDNTPGLVLAGIGMAAVGIALVLITRRRAHV